MPDREEPLSHHDGENSNLNSPTTSPNDHEKQNAHWIRRPCLWVAFGIKWLPVIFICVVICWSYYAFVVALCIFTIESLFEKVILLIFYHIIFLLFVTSYLQTIFAPAAVTPMKWHLSTAMVEKLSKAKSEQEWKSLLEVFVVEMELPVVQRSVQGAIRYCEKCRAIKPDRSHHCSVCGKCILKMDHHCPWVGNCVSFSNYKFFMLFLGYALVYCIYIFSADFKYFIWFWTGNLVTEGSARFHVLFLFFVAIMFSISVSSLFWYHIYLVANNRTTLEQFRAPYFNGGISDEHGWSLGKFNNFQEVFGDNKWTWFLPIQTSIGDGLAFPTRLTVNESTSYQSIGATPADVENGLPRCQNGNSKKSTEVVIDSKDRVSIKVRHIDE